MIFATSAAAQRIAYDSMAGSWTLTSGPVSYRLVRRAEQVTFDYFGPTSRMGHYAGHDGAAATL